MRSIKFRIWDKKYQTFLCYSPNVTSNGFCWWNSKEEFFVSEGSWTALYFDDLREDNNYIIQQFTGLLDKNGKEIYEGDIIGFEKVNNNKEIIFKFGAFCAKGIGREFDWEKDYGMPGNLDGIGNPWIAKGNIFENSELLK